MVYAWTFKNEWLISYIKVKQYFGPASEYARVGAAVHRVHGEDFQDCADRLLVQDDVQDLLKHVPDEGWFVRTESCSPKDSEHDGGVGPHYDLHCILVAVAASNRCQKSLRLENYEQDLSLYITPFDLEVRTSRELRVFVYHGKGVRNVPTSLKWLTIAMPLLGLD